MVQLPFLKKKEEMIHGKGYAPIDRVREMAARGLSEPEMIDTLRREGFSPTEIDTALTQALKISVAPPTPTPELAEETKLPTLEEITKPTTPQVPETSLPQEYYAQTYPTEDYIDYVVQSRVAEVNEKINEFAVRYQELEKRMHAMQEQLTELSKIRSGEQQEILNKIDNFSETVTNVNSRVGGLEKAFKETLPALIESVRSLSDLVQRMKREV